MRHLRTDEFVDIAEGARAESSSAHLASCEACRSQLADVRAAMAAAAEADVPEPSPMFWHHLSQRVREAVVNEPQQAKGWRGALRRLLWRRAVVEPVASLAVIALIVFAAMKALAPVPHDGAPPSGSGASAVAASGASDAAADVSIDADPLLAIVASLASALDVDAGAVLEDSATADHAVAHLTDDELREMQRMLQSALQRQQSGD